MTVALGSLICFLMDGELYIHTSFSSMLWLGGSTFVLLSPPGFVTSLRGVTGVWRDGLLALVVMVLTAATVWQDGLLAFGSLTRFFDVTTNLFRCHGCVAQQFFGVGGDGDGCYGVAQRFCWPWVL